MPLQSNGNSKNRMAGFALMSAIFIIVILALLVTYMTRFSTETFSETGLTIQGVHAFYASKSGLEWAATVSLNNGSICPTATGGTCAANTSCFTFSQGALTAFSANVLCKAVAVTEGTSYTIFYFTSQGVTGTIKNPGYSIRTLTASVTNAF